MSKVYTIFAGVNGAGKTTLYNTHINDSLGVRVNCDEVLHSFGGDWKSQNDQAKALIISLRLIDDAIKTGKNINHETILTGNSYDFISRIKSSGYLIRLYYVGIDSPEIAITRVDNRVKLGGHGIAHEDIIRRYTESIDNLKLVLPLCKEVYIYDNTKDLLKVAEILDGKIEIFDKYCSWLLGLNIID